MTGMREEITKQSRVRGFRGLAKRWGEYIKVVVALSQKKNLGVSSFYAAFDVFDVVKSFLESVQSIYFLNIQITKRVEGRRRNLI